MTIRSSIDKQRRLVLTKIEGCLTFDEARRHQDRLLADSEFDPSFNQLIDATSVTKVDLSADEARTIAQRHIFSPKSRRAIVSAKPVVFGIARMGEIYHEDAAHTEVEVFYSMEEALKWLGGEAEKHQNHGAEWTDPEE